MTVAIRMGLGDFFAYTSDLDTLYEQKMGNCLKGRQRAT